MMIDISSLLENRLSAYQRDFAEQDLPKAFELLIGTSDYACRHINILKELLISKEWQGFLSFNEFQSALATLNTQSMQSFGQALRRFRHKHLLRLILRELAGLASTEDSMLEWSNCADAIILKTLEFCEQELQRRYGQPCDAHGKSCALFCLAMGKLGGRELNYSSDIDLIFAFSASGWTNGDEIISNQQYYSKVVQAFIQILQTISPDGFVFRVDLRLRPNGDSGALVSSLSAMETYYQEQGRDWERYAMIKARLIGDSVEEPNHWFHRLITPFVYRRYVDFSVIESLRSMKAMIEREVQLNPRLDDIKRGFGGIREIEFVIQNIQLIRGGRFPQLREQNTLKALARLKQLNLLSHTNALKQAYLFLRKLENTIQSQNDQQIHSLPKDEVKQAQIAIAMGYSNWQVLLNRLEQFQRIISAAFRSVLAKADPYQDEKRVLANQLMSLWQGHVETTMAINLLVSLGFDKAERCYQMIHAFRHSARCRRLSQAARLRLDRFMVLLLSELGTRPNTENLLLKVIQMLENIVGRSSYLALITENPPVLQELLHWFGHSPFITSILLNHPFLLEVLLDQEQDWRLPSRKQLEENLTQLLAHTTESEQQEEALRQFKWMNWLSAARAEVYGCYPAIRVSRFLSTVAEVVVARVLNLASERLSLRYPQMPKIKSNFAVVAYGKLGSREMNYNSDLDLVFIHSTHADEEGLVTRLTQKILHMLTTRSQSGILYSVDTRLRPSGEAGLLVSHIDAFSEYQRHHAWTWEHQALIRARFLTGSLKIQQQFKRLRQDILMTSREESLLRDEVLAMRIKIHKHSSGDEIKYGPGGLIDIEFLVQFLVLTHSNASLLRSTNILSLLQALYGMKALTRTQFIQLRAAYQHFHQQLHEDILNLRKNNLKEHQQNVLEICRDIYKTKNLFLQT
nr:bifunctional [glutamate--ammonia ligase]-adenylyl-L-tyrosine phosphorylase/[glutamate--ammonia-ligase] adenylyltransferase [Legionella jordanis]